MKLALNKLNKLKSIPAQFLSASFLKVVAQSVLSLLTLKYIDTTNLGIWQIVVLIQSFSYLFHLGLLNGLSRDVPFLIGKNNNTRLFKELETSVFFLNFLYVILFVISIILCFVLYQLNYWSILNGFIVLTGYVQIVYGIQTSYYNSIYRGSDSFKKLVRLNLYSIVVTVILFPLIYFYSFYGFLAWQNLIAVITLYLFWKKRPYLVTPKFHKIYFFNLINIGFPILVNSIISIFNKNLVRFFLLFWGSLHMLGLYAFVAFIVNGFAMFPNILSQYLYPKINHMYGKHNDKTIIYNYIQSKRKIIFRLGILIVIPLIIFVPYLIEIFIPKFIEVSLAARMAIIIGFINCIQIGVNLFNTVKKSNVLSLNFFIKSIVFVIISLIVIYFNKDKNILNDLMVVLCFSEFVGYLLYEYQLKKIFVIKD